MAGQASPTEPITPDEGTSTLSQVTSQTLSPIHPVYGMNCAARLLQEYCERESMGAKDYPLHAEAKPQPIGGGSYEPLEQPLLACQRT